MPIQFDSLFSFKSPSPDSAMVKLFSNPFYTAIAITCIFVVFLYIFSPLKKDKFKVYFRLFLYFGAINSLILFYHDDFIIKVIEKKYAVEEEITHEQIKVQPQLDGQLDVDGGRELDELTEELTKDIGEELFETL
jgi:hypothetical protein